MSAVEHVDGFGAAYADMVDDAPEVVPAFTLPGGACGEPDAPPLDDWFPEGGPVSAEVRATCDRCPIRAECREHAIQYEPEWGFMGGTTPTERQAERARRSGSLTEVTGQGATVLAAMRAMPSTSFARFQIATLLGLSPNQTGAVLQRLVASGHVERVGRGLYRATPT